MARGSLSRAAREPGRALGEVRRGRARGRGGQGHRAAPVWTVAPLKRVNASAGIGTTAVPGRFVGSATVGRGSAETATETGTAVGAGAGVGTVAVVTAAVAARARTIFTQARKPS